MSKQKQPTFYIKFKNLKKFTQSQLMELFQKYSEIHIVFPWRDRLSLRKTSGDFYSIGKLNYLDLAYNERLKGLYFEDRYYEMGKRHYIVNSPELFHVSEIEMAIMALVKRANNPDHGLRAVGLGGSIQDVKDEDDRLKIFPRSAMCGQ